MKFGELMNVAKAQGIVVQVFGESITYLDKHSVQEKTLGYNVTNLYVQDNCLFVELCKQPERKTLEALDYSFEVGV